MGYDFVLKESKHYMSVVRGLYQTQLTKNAILTLKEKKFQKRHTVEYITGASEYQKY